MGVRRTKGEGSITKRSDGRWMGRYGGKVVYGRTKAEASDKLRVIKAQVDSNEFSADLTTIEKAMRLWLIQKGRTIKPSSFDRIEQIVECHIIPFVGSIGCNEFSEKIFVSQIIDRMINQGLSYSSVKKAQDNMCAFCKWASSSSRKLMLHNPLESYEKLSGKAFVQNIEPDEGVAPPSSFISEEDREKFIIACRSKFSSGNLRFKYGEAYIFDMYTGLRMGELLALTWNDIDFNTRTVNVSKGVCLVKDRDPQSPSYGKKVFRIFPYTKTGKPRIVPLGDMAYQAAQNLYNNRNKMAQYVVANNRGATVQFCTFSAMLTRVYDLAGIQTPSGSNVHALRHTFASMCFAAGVPVRTVSELLGHSSVQITMDIYIHLIQKSGVIHVPELDTLK